MASNGVPTLLHLSVVKLASWVEENDRRRILFLEVGLFRVPELRPN